jgi:hypothetical protein
VVYQYISEFQQVEYRAMLGWQVGDETPSPPARSSPYPGRAHICAEILLGWILQRSGNSLRPLVTMGQRMPLVWFAITRSMS